jgi:hypothetical protein
MTQERFQMKTIQIEDDVYAFLQEQAIPFKETTPGMTLRRLLGLGRPPARRLAVRRPGTRETARVKAGRRQPKADLEVLVSADYLKQAETLELRDYQGRKIDGGEARVAGNGLSHNGRTYSMSALAAKLLKESGYRGDSVRGPAHWFTKRGKSVKELWDEMTNS